MEKILNAHKDFAVNDEIYFFYDEHLNCNKGVIKNIIQKDNEIYFVTNWMDGGISHVPEKYAFKTEDDCRYYYNLMLTKRTQEYANQIKTMDDLIEFCIEIMRSAEDPDYIAIEVAKDKYAYLKNNS